MRPADEHYMCPVRALAQWLMVSNIRAGYVFPPISSGGQIGSSESHIGSEKFLELFRNNLLDIFIDPYPYGTHSFRRGGCQWLASGCRWPLRRICEWGGWSSNLTHLTIVKYLISWNDDPAEPREDFMNPHRNSVFRCHACGRSCHCS
ncbi:hypothetical protein FKP32DRAFT_1560972 [Trametes sanguinea]|nr:hypothetical protein FKP32DRAFT_1560972 [Trametes sanguinea]